MRRKFDNPDRCCRSQWPEPAGDTFGWGRGGVEDRNALDPYAVDLNIAGDRVQTIERKFLKHRLGAEFFDLAHQPRGAGYIASSPGTVNGVGIPCRQPSRCACYGGIRHIHHSLPLHRERYPVRGANLPDLGPQSEISSSCYWNARQRGARRTQPVGRSRRVAAARISGGSGAGRRASRSSWTPN